MTIKHVNYFLCGDRQQFFLCVWLVVVLLLQPTERSQRCHKQAGLQNPVAQNQLRASVELQTCPKPSGHYETHQLIPKQCMAASA